MFFFQINTFKFQKVLLNMTISVFRYIYPPPPSVPECLSLRPFVWTPTHHSIKCEHTPKFLALFFYLYNCHLSTDFHYVRVLSLPRLSSICHIRKSCVFFIRFIQTLFLAVYHQIPLVLTACTISRCLQYSALIS